MSDPRIIFPSDDGGVRVLIPAMNNAINDDTGHWMPLLSVNDALPDGYRLATINDIAAKDVPAGKTFQVIDAADLPDRSSRDSWEWV